MNPCKAEMLASYLSLSVSGSVYVCLHKMLQVGFWFLQDFYSYSKTSKVKRKMGIWVLKSFSPHHLCSLTMKRSPKNSHIHKLGMNNNHNSSMSMRKKQNAEVKTKAKKKEARLQFYNITNRTTPKRRRRKHRTTKEVSSFSQDFSQDFSLKKKK